MAFLLAADAPYNPVDWHTFQTAAASIGGGGALVITALSVAIAVSLQPLQFRLVQLLEGYWPAWFPAFLSRLGVWLEMRRRDRIVDRISVSPAGKSAAAIQVAHERAQTAESQLRQRFPPEDRLLPTALGNALRASEDSVGRRYGLESVVIWPRLFHLLPERVRAGMDDEVTQLDVSVRLTVTWTAAGVACTLLLLRDVPALFTNPLWLVVAGGIFILARLSYQSAVESAIAQGVDVEVAIDLYRARVIDAMRLKPSASLRQERRIFGELCELFQTTTESDADMRFDPSARAGGPDG